MINRIQQWEILIDQFRIDGNPQSKRLTVVITAPTAEDALTIARIRHSAPCKSDQIWGDRTVVDIRPIVSSQFDTVENFLKE